MPRRTVLRVDDVRALINALIQRIEVMPREHLTFQHVEGAKAVLEELARAIEELSE